MKTKTNVSQTSSHFLVKSASNMRLLFLSGTPMFDNYKEIIWLDQYYEHERSSRNLIKVSDVFDAKGNFRKAEKGEVRNRKRRVNT